MANSGARPNILYIMSDDHASNAISAYGSRLAKHAPTPCIDRIGAEGIRFENCYCTNSICTPSRATILTGQHSHVNGVRTLADALPETCVTLPEWIRAGGYQTALFGKWHLHCRPRGFDQWAILPGQGRYHDPLFISPDAAGLAAGAQVDPAEVRGEDQRYVPFGVWTRHTGYVTDVVTDMSIDWLRRRRREGRPFFLCCHHKAPHDFFEYPARHGTAFKGTVFDEPETFFEDEATLGEISRRYGSTVSERFEQRNMVKHLMDPGYPNGGPVDFSGLDFDGRARKAYQTYMRDYLRTVRGIDENVGRMLDCLDELGLTEDTLVVYTSDQGMMLGEHDKIDKRWIFDESQRMPLLIRYPKGILPGTVNRDMVDNLDFAPTLLDMAGCAIPATMQGRSFRPLLHGRAPAGWRQSVYYRYWMHMAHHWVPAHYGIRTPTRKLVFFYGLPLDASGCDTEAGRTPTDPGFELYDLEKDPLERHNVYRDEAYAADVRSLKRELLDLKRACGDDDVNYPELARLRERLW